MSNDLAVPELPVTQELHRPMTTSELLQQSQLIHDVLTKVMVDGIHYGKIPGTGDKPTLYLAGAEKIDATFRLAPKFDVEDLSEPHNNFYRYRVRCSLYTIRDSFFVGSAVGEASSAEEKYQWERAVCHEQWETLPSDQRRIKWKKGKDGDVIQIEQIRTNAADIANTVLKIAAKRAHVSASKGATAASDILEVDFDEEAVQDLKRKEQQEDAPQKEASKPKAKAKPAPKLAFGRSKGKEITDPSVPVDDLTWMRYYIVSKLDDPARAKWKANDQLMIQAIEAELAARTKNTAAANAEPPTDQREPMRDDEWGQFTLQMDHEFHDAYVQVKTEFKVKDSKSVAVADRWRFYDRIQQVIAG